LNVCELNVIMIFLCT